MIMDTNKCIACQSCTIACKSTWTWGKGQEYMLWNNIETKPFGFYPTGWDVNVLDLLGKQSWDGTTSTRARRCSRPRPTASRCSAGRPTRPTGTTRTSARTSRRVTPPRATYVAETPHSMMWMYYLQRICNHCTYPACVAACPRDAIYKRPEDGVVLVDQTRCRGYQECLTACPYKKTMFNLETRVSEKCIGCYPKLEQGLQTQCTTSCIGRLRLTNFLSRPDEIDPRKPADFLVHVRKIALPLYPQLGLEPNVYYIPPMHVPVQYLEQMFGPGVEARDRDSTAPRRTTTSCSAC